MITSVNFFRKINLKMYGADQKRYYLLQAGLNQGEGAKIQKCTIVLTRKSSNLIY